MNNLEKNLSKVLQGDLRFDAVSRQIYSVDASIYEIEPLGVVLPKTMQDLSHIVKVASENDISLIPRGAATGIAGGCIGKGLIVDLSKYFTKIKSINTENKSVICESGVIQDQLNLALSHDGYRLGPETSTGNRATLGGMLSTNAAGAKSLYYGAMVHHVKEVELLLYDNSLIRLKPISQSEWESLAKKQNREGKLYHCLLEIKKKYQKGIAQNFPKIPRRSSGYNLNALLENPFNPAKLIAGAEGTLGIVTEMTLGITENPQTAGLCLFYFSNLAEAFEYIPTLLKYNLLSLELIDDTIIKMAKISPTAKKDLQWIEKEAKAILVCEVNANNQSDAIEALEKIKLNKNGIHKQIITDSRVISQVWRVRKQGLGLLLSKRSYTRAVAFIEDITVPPQRLKSFITKFLSYFQSIGKEAGIYGHAGEGCLHIRPYLDLRDNSEIDLMKKIIDHVSSLVIEHEGVMSGEHGDGIVRSWLHPKMFGNEIYQAFVELKQAFDPLGKMNPGKIVRPASFLENLRLSPQTRITPIKTTFDFSNQGGFELAADLCNGNGECRKQEQVMCPSFQATNDERHTTRARAQALRGIIHGKLPKEAMASKELFDVMDLCILCKGCKTECPSQVDMAKMKAEFLHHYHKKHRRKLRDYLFANIGTLFKWMSPFAWMINPLMQTNLSKFLMNFLGISTKHTFPTVTSTPFSKWSQKQSNTHQNQKQVVLFSDTFTEFHQTEVGKAAYHVIKALGYAITVPEWRCCGRPLISKGLLPQAKKKAAYLIDILYPYAKQKLPIIGLEPSCIFTIKDDLQDLTDHKEKAIEVANACITFDEWVASHLIEGKLPSVFTLQENSALFHGHCHQKAFTGTKSSLNVLNALFRNGATEIPSGCCGMAGAFGYEKEHEEISQKIGNLHLIPAVLEADALTQIVANGLSCKTQIEIGTEKNAKHLAEILFKSLQMVRKT